MNKAILFFISLLFYCIASIAQPSGEKMLFVIDSIPLYDDPEDWNSITNDDIADFTIIRDKDSLKRLGWKDVDGITYIFTKEYRGRPDSLKRIPSLKQMEMKDGAWHLASSPYSGRYIDYYNSGRIQNEGTLVNGKLHGSLIVYFKTGIVKSVSNYRAGMLHGLMKQYYKNGALMFQRELAEGRGKGINEKSESYYINGQKGYELRQKQATPYDTIVTFYSTGRIKEKRVLKGGEPVRRKNENDLAYYSTMFQQALNKGDIKEANKNFYKLWLLDSISPDTRHKEGLLLAREYHFDEAITQFDKVLEIEPLDRNTLLQRGLARIKKYHPSFSKALPKGGKEPPITAEDFRFIPEEEEVKICNDLLLADDLDPSDYWVKKAIPEAILAYCRKKSSR